jgi:hypothetical protein
MSRTSYCNKVPFRYLLWALCHDVQLCNRCVREFLILARTWFTFGLCRRFDPGGSLDRRVNCCCVSHPRWVGARRNTRGSKRGNHGSCCPAPRADELAVGGYKRSRGRERACASARPPARPPLRTRALDLLFIDVRSRPRCTMGSAAMC